MKIKIRKLTNWLLLIMTILYFVSGFALVRDFGFEHIMSRHVALFLHKNMAFPFLILLLIHISPMFKIKLR